MKKESNNSIKYPMGSGWFYESEIVGKAGRRLEYKYSYKNTKINRFELESTTAKNYSSYFAILRDINFVIEYLEVINSTLERGSDSDPEDNRVTIIHGLFIAALVTYFRCFNEGRGRTIRLNPNKIFRKGSKLLSQHFKIRDLRNSSAAHWGDNLAHAEMCHTPVLLSANMGGKVIDSRFWSEISTPYYGKLKELHQLCMIVNEFVFHKLEELEFELMCEAEVIKIDDQRLVTDICMGAKVNSNEAVDLVKILYKKYGLQGGRMAKLGSNKHHIQFEVTSHEQAEPRQRLIDCRFEDDSWIIDEIEVDISAKT